MIEKQLTWENWEIQLTEDNRIHVVDIINEINEELDFKDRFFLFSYFFLNKLNLILQKRVINMSLEYNNLVVTTSSQCYIYNLTVIFLFFLFYKFLVKKLINF